MTTRLFIFGRGDDGQIGVGDTSDALMPVEVPFPFQSFIPRSGVNHVSVSSPFAPGSASSSAGAASSPAAAAAGSASAGASSSSSSSSAAAAAAAASPGATGAGSPSQHHGAHGAHGASGAGAAAVGSAEEGGAVASAAAVAAAAARTLYASFPRASDTIVQASCGSGHTVVLTAQGRVWTFGRGDDGRLGHNDASWKYVPRMVQALAAERIVYIASGSYHTAVVSASGAVYTWGGGLFGKLGLGNETGRLAPALVEGLRNRFIVQVACGSRHTVALADDGDVFSWGDNEQGVTGIGVSEATHTYRPALITTLRGKGVKALSATGFHSGARTEAGEVYTWGEGKFGRLGHGSEANASVPKLVEALRGKRVVMFACGGFHSAAVVDTGHLYTWGGGEHGQLGHGDRVNRNSPTLVEALLGHVVVQVAAGWSHNVVLTDANQVFSWGNADHGKLGHHDVARVTSPRLIESLREFRVVQVASYNEHTAVLVQSPEVISSSLEAVGGSGGGAATTRMLSAAAESTLSADFREMLRSGAFADVVFVTSDGSRLPAHRAVLAGRCEYFGALFHSGMRESSQSEIRVDMGPRVFGLVLEYLYTDELVGEILPNEAVELYVAADLYQIENLKVLAEDLVFRSLVPETSPIVLLATQSFGAAPLKEICLKHIVRNFDACSKTEAFAALPRELILDILQRR